MVACWNGFSKAAPTYDGNASVQDQITATLMDRLPEDLRPTSILDIGCGTGLLTRRLAERFPRARITALDAAPGMVRACRERFRDRPGMEVKEADIATWDSRRAFDLVTSSSSLQWVRPLEVLLDRLAELVTLDGLLAFAGMLKGTLAELHECRGLALPHHASAPPMPDADVWRAGLESRGFATEIETCTWMETPASPQDLFRALHAMGANGPPYGSLDRLLTRSELDRLAATYRERFGRPDGTIPATYQIGWFIARPCA